MILTVVTVLTNIAVALRGPVELADEADAEALLELAPDLGLDAVAEHEAHAVRLLLRAERLCQQVAADLPDVLRHLSHNTVIIYTWSPVSVRVGYNRTEG